MIVILIKMTFITVADDNDMLPLLKVIRTLSVCLFNNLFIIIIL